MKYSFEYIQTPRSGTAEGGHYRVRDEQDNRVATCYLEDNAKTVVEALNVVEEATTAISENARLRKENDVLRGLVQCNPEWKCTYGYLGADKQPLKSMGQCPLGFPGCSCGDDLMCAMHPDLFERPKIGWHPVSDKPAKTGQYLCKLPHQYIVCSYETSSVDGQPHWNYASIDFWAEIPQAPDHG